MQLHGSYACMHGNSAGPSINFKFQALSNKLFHCWLPVKWSLYLAQLLVGEKLLQSLAQHFVNLLCVTWQILHRPMHLLRPSLFLPKSLYICGRFFYQKIFINSSAIINVVFVIVVIRMCMMPKVTQSVSTAFHKPNKLVLHPICSTKILNT